MRRQSSYDAEPAEALEVARDFYTLMSQRMFLPNSPCLTNAGRGSGMLSACFVLPVEDSVESVYDAVKATALIQKAGGGTGFSFSKVREAGDRVEGTGGHGAGPLTFMEVFEGVRLDHPGSVPQGREHSVLRVDHPDVADFVVHKDDRAAHQLQHQRRGHRPVPRDAEVRSGRRAQVRNRAPAISASSSARTAP